jgi:hypothetical protein
MTFTALAVVLALRSHDESSSNPTLVLLIAVLGTLLAVLVADTCPTSPCTPHCPADAS